MIRIGIIGYGYWGPNLARNFMEAKGAEVVGIADARPDRLDLARKRYPSMRLTTDYHELLNDPLLDAVAIATPVVTHYAIAMEALQRGKHVLVEKPMTASSDQAQELISQAARHNLILMVDHTFAYTPAVRKMKELVSDGSVGDIYYYDSVRINLGLFQHDVNVLWDLAVHDLSIIDFVLNGSPCGVSATGMGHVTGRPEDIAYLTLFFDAPLIAHIHVNWLAPVKVRRTLIGGSKKMLVYDDLEPSEKIKTYDKGITLTNNPEANHQMLIGYRTGDMWAPQLSVTEALQTEASHFVNCIEGRERPETGGDAGLRVVRILEAATRSLAQQGRHVELSLARRSAA